MPNKDFQNGLILGAAAGKPKGSSITVDATLSTESENPVQNKVVTQALNGKLSLSGGTLTGNLALGNNTISGVGRINTGTGTGSVAMQCGNKRIIAVANPSSATDATNKQYVDAAIAAGGTQSDWNQSDNTAVDYIKNRPFYEDSTVIPTKSINITYPDQFITVAGFNPEVSIGQEVQVNYSLTISGTTVTATATNTVIEGEDLPVPILVLEAVFTEGQPAESVGMLAFGCKMGDEGVELSDTDSVLVLTEGVLSSNGDTVGLTVHLSSTQETLVPIPEKYLTNAIQDNWSTKEEKIGYYFGEPLYEQSKQVEMETTTKTITLTQDIGSILYVEKCLLKLYLNDALISVFEPYYSSNNYFEVTCSPLEKRIVATINAIDPSTYTYILDIKYRYTKPVQSGE